MAGPLTSLPPVKPLSCQSQLTFTEFNRVVSDLMIRDRVLEEALINFTSVSSLQLTASLLSATETILGKDLVADVIASGALPGDFQDFATFQAMVTDRLGTLEKNTIVTDEDGENPKSLKALVLSNQQTIGALNSAIDEFDKELAGIKALTDDIAAVKEVVDTVNTRISDLENLLGDLADEVKNARKELASDPSKRLVDKIDAIDSAIVALQTTLNAVVKEMVDARSADRFDSVAERIGELESNLEAFEETLSNLRGRGIVTGIKVGRSILHGVTELIPGSNIAITRERNGLRIDVVEKATCIDMSAPIGDPNAACCGPSNVTIGN